MLKYYFLADSYNVGLFQVLFRIFAYPYSVLFVTFPVSILFRIVLVVLFPCSNICTVLESQTVAFCLSVPLV